MRVLLSTYGSRGDVEPMVELAVQLGALGAEVRVCAPPDFAELLAGVGVPLVPIGQPVRPPPRAAGWVATQFDTVAAVAEGCDALAAGGVMPAGVWL
jgi:vancomycin aglycone glucosyltransferase